MASAPIAYAFGAIGAGLSHASSRQTDSLHSVPSRVDYSPPSEFTRVPRAALEMYAADGRIPASPRQNDAATARSSAAVHGAKLAPRMSPSMSLPQAITPQRGADRQEAELRGRQLR